MFYLEPDISGTGSRMQRLDPIRHAARVTADRLSELTTIGDEVGGPATETIDVGADTCCAVTESEEPIPPSRCVRPRVPLMSGSR